MPERLRQNPDINAVEIFNSNELTEQDLIRIGQICRLELGLYQNAVYPSPRLSGKGLEVIFCETTIGVIRPATIFRIEGVGKFSWDNPSVFVEEERVVFKSNSFQSLGHKIVVSKEDTKLVKPRNKRELAKIPNPSA